MDTGMSQTIDSGAVYPNQHGLPTTPSANSDYRCFLKIPHEVELKIFKYIRLFPNQLKLAKLRSHEANGGSCRMIETLVEANKHTMFRNPKLIRYIFGHTVFQGESPSPRLFPNHCTYDIYNPDKRDYRDLINEAIRQDDAHMEVKLRGAVENHLVQYRAEAVLQSRQKRLQIDKPTREQKAELQLPASDKRDYAKLLQDHAGDDESYKAIKQARSQGECIRLAARDKFGLMQCIFDALDGDTDELTAVCRGCFKQQQYLRPEHYMLCLECYDVYCEDYMISESYLISLHVDPTCLILPCKYRGSCDPWFGRETVNGSHYYPKRMATILIEMMFGSTTTLSSLEGTVSILPRVTIQALKVRFKAITGVVKEIFAQAHSRRLGQHRPVEDLSQFGFTPSFFKQFDQSMETDITRVEFMEDAFMVAAEMYDTGPQAALDRPNNWRRATAAYFWDIELEMRYEMYTHNRLYQTFAIQPVKEWKRWFNTSNKLEDFACSQGTAQMYAQIIHGCTLDSAAALLYPTKLRNLSEFLFKARITEHILKQYPKYITQTCMDLLAVVCGEKNGFALFLGIMMAWLNPYAAAWVGGSDEMCYDSVPDYPVEWSQDTCKYFWKYFARDSAVGPVAGSPTILDALNQWAFKRVVMVPEKFVQKMDELPRFLQLFAANQLIPLKENDPRLRQPGTQRSGSVAWQMRTPNN
ncbi:hypothetical protein LTR37_006410 [Vermiconidia calcicola]|uniref:Uncharacterized protein n=1 Tax=Vermiconidia calcicola TaxID=1690605 RepID=A0ACC3NGH6_9PEZI|nr:hypothetical protein LTR37_006410 [Vermiconidia calcicola]